MSVPAHVMAEFDRCWPWLEAAAACAVAPKSKAEIRHEIESGQAHLWPADHSCAVTKIFEADGRRLLEIWLGGGDLGELLATERSIEAFARENGCEQIVISGRRGWGRALDRYREAFTVYVKDVAA